MLPASTVSMSVHHAGKCRNLFETLMPEALPMIKGGPDSLSTGDPRWLMHMRSEDLAGPSGAMTDSTLMRNSGNCVQTSAFARQESTSIRCRGPPEREMSFLCRSLGAVHDPSLPSAVNR